MSKNTIQFSDLPLSFPAKFIGSCKAPGAWGVENIREPVDLLVERSKSSRKTRSEVTIKVTESGLQITQSMKNEDDITITFKIEMISYGVQDTQFTRVFCFIITKPYKPEGERHTLHAFACPSKSVAQSITQALGCAFKHLADTLKTKEEQKKAQEVVQIIQLRPDENDDEDEDSEADA